MSVSPDSFVVKPEAALTPEQEMRRDLEGFRILADALEWRTGFYSTLYARLFNRARDGASSANKECAPSVNERAPLGAIHNGG